MRVLPTLVVLLLAYVSLDFASPLLPGAVSFDPSDSVEAVRASQARAGDTAVVAVTARPTERLRTSDAVSALVRLEPAIRGPRERLGHRRRSPTPAPAPTSEDH